MQLDIFESNNYPEYKRQQKKKLQETKMKLHPSIRKKYSIVEVNGQLRLVKVK